MRNSQQIQTRYIWVAASLLGMGILDGFHASVKPGNEFVWLHSLAVFVGGVTFALVLLPERFSKKSSVSYAPLIMATTAFTIGVLSIVFPPFVPAMLDDGKFTLTADLLNIIGGLGFVLAWYHFVRGHDTKDKLERHLLASHTMLFGTAGLLFKFSVVWDATWWLWHVLRFVAYIVILVFFLKIYLENVKFIRENQQSLEKERALTKGLIENSPALISLINTEGQLILSNTSYRAVNAHSKSNTQEDYKDLDGHLKALKETITTEIQRMTNTGMRSFLSHRFPLKNSTGEVFAVGNIMTDISKAKSLEAKLEQLAYFDSLTALPNRIQLKRRLEEQINDCKRKNEGIAVLLLDLDNFKLINDSLGHSAGDLVLKETARRLQQQVCDSDMVSRIGGDEFVVLLNGIKSKISAVDTSRKIIDALKQNHEIQTKTIQIDTSIGIATFPDDGANFETLLKHADLAMYSAKSEGKGTFRFFCAELHKKVHRNLELKQELEAAIREDQFELFYQPKIDLKSHKILGAEALIRWNHPSKGIVFPDEFIDFAERSELIIPIGNFVLHEACRQIQQWSLMFDTPIHISINLSTKQFKSTNLINDVKQVLLETELPAQQLEFEITESSIMQDVESAMKTMQELTNSGIELSIDDFGTGYSSLNYLKKFPITNIKIDRGFVKDILTDSNDKAIVEVIILLCEKLGLKVTAEGIETHEQLQFLVENGCLMGQGYHFSKPLNAEEFESYLTNFKISH